MRVGTRWAALVVLAGGLTAVGAAPAMAAPLQHAAVGGFPTPGSSGFSIVFADGSVRPGPVGDASALALNAAMTGGAGVPAGGGYWEVGADGGVFSYGTARFFGSMGDVRLNQPVFSMAPTKTGAGYWLVARDGGIFSFGDARYHGSAATLPLQQPIAGITTSASGLGYRLVARDGGIFSYGDATFYGSLPGIGVVASDVVGMARTPDGKGYWIARANGQVYAFGDAPALGSVAASPCDAITAIISSPVGPAGYRLVTASGASIPFVVAPFTAPRPIGTPVPCGKVGAHLEFSATTVRSGASISAYLVVDNESGAALSFPPAGTSGCPQWAITLATPSAPNPPIFSQGCIEGRPLVFPVGASELKFTLPAITWASTTPLAPGNYSATLAGGLSQFGFPSVATVPVTVTS